MNSNMHFDDEIFSFDAIEHNEDQNEEKETENEKEISPQAEIWTQKIGPAPTDYLIIVQTTVFATPEVTPTYVLVWSHPESLEYFVTKHPVIKDKQLLSQEDRGEPEEEYEQVLDAKESRYFNEIFTIDRILDRKIAELKDYEKDTKYAPHGLRTVSAWGQYYDLYAEQYLEESPEHHEYIQVHGRNGRYLYSASHESYARLHELGDMYEVYLGHPPKENYFMKFLTFKDLLAKNYKYALPLKALKHIAMEEMLETDHPLPEFAGKDLGRLPILTSVRGGPAEGVYGALTEATIDVNPAIRIYVIVARCEEKPDMIILSKHSRFNDSIVGKYHAFDFDWEPMILKAFEDRESACNDAVYGDLFIRIYKLNEEIAESKKPYCWRKGMDDPYGFANIALSELVGSEIDTSSFSINYNSKPKNLRMMVQPHPSATVTIKNYEMVPLKP